MANVPEGAFRAYTHTWHRLVDESLPEDLI